MMPACLLMSRDEAKDAGATHDGYLFGLPVWVTEDGGAMPAVAAKFRPAELYLSACLAGHALLQACGIADGFFIYLGDPIK